MTVETDKSAICDYVVDEFRLGSLCPVIGAGASMDAGLPHWTGWATRFARSVAPRAREANLGVDTTWAFECVRGTMSELEYRARLRDSLYPRSYGPERRTRRFVANYQLARLVGRIAELAVDAELAGQQAGRSLGLSSDFDAISYNLDCLLELQINLEGGRAEAHVPFLAGTTPFHVYEFEPPSSVSRARPVARVIHPHGILPIDSDKEETEDRARRLPLVMAAEDYEARGGTTDVWQNTVQLGAFVHRTCLFYGFSFTDPAVRKLLRLSMTLQGSRAGQGHVAFLQEPETHSIPSREEREDALERLGFSHVFWSSRDPGVCFEDQISLLSAIVARIDGA